MEEPGSIIGCPAGAPGGRLEKIGEAVKVDGLSADSIGEHVRDQAEVLVLEDEVGDGAFDGRRREPGDDRHVMWVELMLPVADVAPLRLAALRGDEVVGLRLQVAIAVEVSRRATADHSARVTRCNAFLCRPT